ncbi:hypothetical protein AB0I30_19025 [Nocardia tengchongensis]|uniref:hypothetical protein n=1 Tax=Nocardia tengchongensis TaxID=2055889 RepID=UPI0033E3988F
MAKPKKPMSRRTELRLGRDIQEQYDWGASWTAITVHFELPEYKVKRLARIYRDDCDRRAHENQLTLFE